MIKIIYGDKTYMFDIRINHIIFDDNNSQVIVEEKFKLGATYIFLYNNIGGLQWL